MGAWAYAFLVWVPVEARRQGCQTTTGGAVHGRPAVDTMKELLEPGRCLGNRVAVGGRRRAASFERIDNRAPLSSR